MCIYWHSAPFYSSHPSIAQLVERWTVVGTAMQKSIGRWFKSGSKEIFFFKFLEMASDPSNNFTNTFLFLACVERYTPNCTRSALPEEHEQVCIKLALKHEILGSIVVSIPACHAGDRGSIPRRGGFFFLFLSSIWAKCLALCSWLLYFFSTKWCSLSLTFKIRVEVA